MVNLVGLALFGVLFLGILAIISNVGEDSINNIQDQMFLSNCPLPIYAGVANLNTINGFAINYTVTYSASNNTGTYFECQASGGLFGVNTVIKDYGATLFDFIPYGWLGYIADFLTSLFQRLYAVFTLLSFFIAPTNFNILGYTLDDLSGIPLMVVIMVYGISYIFIGSWLYKTVSPFSGSGA